MNNSVEAAPARVGQPRPRASREQFVASRLVRRPRLFARLSGVPTGGVVLVCAPPGSGKTLLLHSWVEAEALGDRTAWLSVERGERDGQRFWLAMIDELARAAGGNRVVDPMSRAPGFCAEVVVERLRAELGALDDPVMLVIDDLHELDSEEALDCLARLLQDMPARLRVAVGTRVEPRLGLHRLRVGGRLTEIRCCDLRFSVAETRELLEQAGIALSDAAVALLHERTEGWAAGLRLAATALAGQRNPERWVCEFSGGERTVAEYLLAEVLDQQPPEVRELLLRTSILDRVSGPLADALTGGSASERILQTLADDNAFVMATDPGRTWFRYHDLLADLLRLELRRTAPTIIRSLHCVAARWYEEQACVVKAIRHAQAAGDWPNATRLLAEHNLDQIVDGRQATIRALLAAMPTRARAADAELAITFAEVALSDGLLDEAEVYIERAQDLAEGVPEESRRRFDLRVAHLRLWLASGRGDVEAVVEPMRSLDAALAAVTPEELALDSCLYALALLHLGTTELWSLPLDAARNHLERGLALARYVQRPHLQIGCLGRLAVASVLSGSRLSAATELADEAVAIGVAHGWDEDPVLGMALAARGTASVWLGCFGEAERWLGRAGRIQCSDREPGLAFLLHYGTGLLRFAQGRLDQAVAAFTAAERTPGLLASEHPLSLELHSRIVQAHAALGDTLAARAMLARIAPPLRERAVIRASEATVCLAEGDPEEAVDVLAHALQAVDEPMPLAAPRIDALLCDAVARERLGDRLAAEASVGRALELAGRERIVLPFVLPPARELLEHDASRRTEFSTLLAAIAEALAGSCPSPGEPELVSPAELRVLRYLPSALKADEIAAELYLSTNTVRTHVRRIYAKLGVHTRTQAVLRAAELGLLTRR